VERRGIAANNEAGALKKGAKLWQGEGTGEEEEPAFEIGGDGERERFVASHGDEEAGRCFRQEAASKLLPMGIGPFFDANAGLRAEGDDGSVWRNAGGSQFFGTRGTGGIADRKEEGGSGDVNTKGLQEADRLNDFVLAIVIRHGGGEGGIGAGAVIGNDVAGAAKEANEDVAQIGAEIEEEIEGLVAKLPDEGARGEPGGGIGDAFANFAPPREIGDEELVDGGVILEEVASPWADAEGDMGLRVFFPQGLENGGGHDGIADMIGPEDQNAEKRGGGIDEPCAMEEAQKDIERRKNEGKGKALVRGVDAHFSRRFKCSWQTERRAAMQKTGKE